MDNFAYLNQISKSTRAKSTSVKKPNGFLSNLSISKTVIGGVVIFILLIALGGLLGNINGRPKELSKQIYTRATNLNTAITTYNSSVKSSRLRSIGVSLSTILGHTSNQLASYIGGEDYDADDLVPKKKTLESETALAEELNISLLNAKLNGILDRVYANQITLQVSLLLSLTSQLLARTNDAELTAILSQFHSDLETIHNSLEAYFSPSN